MLQYALILTSDCCQKIMRCLKATRGWSNLRIARILKMPAKYVERVEAGEQSLQVIDLEALSKACRCLPMELIYSAENAGESKSADPFLDGLVATEISRYRKFQKSAFRKSPAGKKRTTTSVA